MIKTTQTWKIGDCLELMKETLLPNSIDLVVTSPPYDNLREYGGYVFDFQSTAKELKRVLKDGGVIIWIVGDETTNGSESGTSFKQALYFKEIGFNLHDTMIYLKRGFQSPSSNRYHQVFEYMFVLSKGKPKTFNPLIDRKNRTAGGTVHGKTRESDGTFSKRSCDGNIILPYGKRYNVWEFTVGGGNISSDNSVHAHPAAFPEQLAKDHILSWSNEGDTVLDPFLGSGTTLKMCMVTNRNGIGFEINPQYEHLYIKRLHMDTSKINPPALSTTPKVIPTWTP